MSRRPRLILAYSFTAAYLLLGFGVALLLRDVPLPPGMVLVLAWGAISLFALTRLASLFR